MFVDKDHDYQGSLCVPNQISKTPVVTDKAKTLVEVTPEFSANSLQRPSLLY
jgi:hypothetical protein